MARKSLSLQKLVSLAIAEDATAPDPGEVGVWAWSSTIGRPVYWDGTNWKSVLSAGLASEVTASKPTPVAADRVFVLDSEDEDAPKLVAIGDLPGGSMAPEDIRDALESLPVGQKLPASAIEGLVAGNPVAVTHDGAGEDPVVGDTLTANFATGWSGSVQWLRDGTPISGATSATYLLVEADEGTQVAPEVTGLEFTAPAVTVAAPAATAPAAFTSGDWTATAGVESIAFNITALPSDGGSALTGLQYTLNGTDWITFSGGATTGERSVTGLTGGVEFPTQVRAVNAVGAGPGSDIKAVTPSAAGASPIVAVQRSTVPFGAGGTIAVPASAQPGDRLVVLMAMPTNLVVTSFDDDQATGYTPIVSTGLAENDRQFVSEPLGAILPTTITFALSGNTLVDPVVVYVLRGASSVVGNQGALSTGYSADVRSHPYTTTGPDEFVFGKLDMGAMDVVGMIGQDSEHLWSLPSGSGYAGYFGGVRPTAGAYSASVGPDGGPSASSGNWFTLLPESSVMSVLNSTFGEGPYNHEITLTIPAVGVGNSLIIAAVNSVLDTRIDGAVRDVQGVPLLYGNMAHFFHIDNVVDGRTSLTLRTLNESGGNAGTTTTWAVLEVDADGVVVGSDISSPAAFSSILEFNGTALDQAFTTTQNGAIAVMMASLSNPATPAGANGWTGLGSALYTVGGYSQSLGGAGAKTASLTLDQTRNRSMAVVAYART